MRGKWFVISGSVAVIALAGVAVTILMRAPAGKTQAAPPVTQAAAPVGDINLPGKIRPQVVINVAPPFEGVIGAYFVDIGQEVFEGQLLVRINNAGLETGQQSAQRELENMESRVNTLESDIITARLEASRARADASRARGEFDRLEKAWRRQQMLFNEGATPKLAYEKAAHESEIAQTEFRTLEQVAAHSESRVAEIVKALDAEKRTLEEKNAELEAAKTRSAAAELVSPTQGIVLALHGDVGQAVAPDNGDFIQIATQLSLLEVVLDPDPPTMRRIQPGQPALVVLPDQGGEGMSGEVKAIQGNQVVVTFVSPNPAIKPGMLAYVRIKAN